MRAVPLVAFGAFALSTVLADQIPVANIWEIDNSNVPAHEQSKLSRLSGQGLQSTGPFQVPNPFGQEHEVSEPEVEALAENEDKSIYDILSGSPALFSTLIKAIDFDEETAEVLKGPSKGITFFAPINPKKRKPHHGSAQSMPEEELDIETADPFAALDGVVSQLTASIEAQDKNKTEILKKIVHAILQYHILPTSVNTTVFAVNSTYATNLTLKDGSNGGEPLRLKVSGAVFGFGGVINYYSVILKSNLKASNGLIHVVRTPLFPPLSTLQLGLLLPDAFSIFTSALQRVGLSSLLEYGLSKNPKGLGSVTVFAPSNSAFQKLPRKLKLFLFSPLGERVLKKLLEYHIVPNQVIFSDYHSEVHKHSCMDQFDPELDDTFIGGSYELTHYADQLQDYFRAPNFRGCRSMHSHGGTWEVNPDVPTQFMRPIDQPRRVPFPGTPLPPHKRPNDQEPEPPHRQPDHRGPEPPQHPHRPPHVPELIKNLTFTLPTLFTNHTVDFKVTQFKILPHLYETKLFAAGVYISNPDVVTRNGAVHIVKRLLNPLRNATHVPPHRGDKSGCECEGPDEWKDWEKLLPAWAAQDET
ncbi:FAS1 domain-containing protein [Sistotremastrum niveocremeum HHB9708]|uniref:FAS1 domain-containing protein n=2 Tax=Sistotremastraceae TaxID=3402574 RepID=A0A165AMJ2_9AGAM|nr:FAS1 domain-containing protein [Sistotremastrum niveocremeum HHB9708]KZT42111.1 FAS1 domain-containing protein [Sistotremastrum suecicum HHB10207 ss-3]